jgi:hypothetical protein
LREKIGSEELENVKAKALRYMTRPALNFKRLLTISEKDPSLSTSTPSDDRSLISQYNKYAAI